MGPQNVDFLLTIARLAGRHHLGFLEDPSTGQLSLNPTVYDVPPLLHKGLVCDLGVLLVGFFDRYGNRFDYHRHAVVVRQGGVSSKIKVWVGWVCGWIVMLLLLLLLLCGLFCLYVHVRCGNCLLPTHT